MLEAWESADDAIKRNALEMATRKINSLPFRGCKLDDTQPLAFPPQDAQSQRRDYDF